LTPIKSDKAFRVTIECENGYPPGRLHWIRKLEMPGSHSLHQVHHLMIDLLDFEDDHLFDFYGSRNSWTRNLVLFEHETYDEYIDGYQSLRLTDVYPMPRFFIDLGLSLYPPLLRLSAKQTIPDVGPQGAATGLSVEISPLIRRKAQRERGCRFLASRGWGYARNLLERVRSPQDRKALRVHGCGPLGS